MIYKLDQNNAIQTLTAAISKTALLCNADLKPDQAKIYAEELLENHKYDHLDTIILALKRGRNGKYGKIYKLSYPVIKEWIANVLEEVAREREKQNTELKKQNTEPLPEVDYEAYKKRIKGRPKKRVSITAIERNEKFIDGICEIHGIEKEVLKSKTRKREIHDLKSICMHFQSEKLKWSQETIGEYWGLERSTISSNIKKVNDLGLVEKETLENPPF